MSFSLKRIEDSHWDFMQKQTTCYTESGNNTLVFHVGERFIASKVGDICYYLLNPINPHTQRTSQIGSQTELATFSGFNPGKLETSSKLNIGKLKCRSV